MWTPSDKFSAQILELNDLVGFKKYEIEQSEKGRFNMTVYRDKWGMVVYWVETLPAIEKDITLMLNHYRML